MAVDTKLGIVREIAAELQEERSEVLVQPVTIAMVHHGRGRQTSGPDAPQIPCGTPADSVQLREVEEILASRRVTLPSSIEYQVAC